MDIKEIENGIMEFVNKRWSGAPKNPTTEDAFIHLTEEVGEIARQIFNKNLGSNKFDKENLKEEIVDVFLDTVILSKMEGVNLEEEVQKKIDRLNKRKELR